MKFIEENIVLIITLTLFVLSIVFWVMYQNGFENFNAFSFYSFITAGVFWLSIKIFGKWWG